jgi:ubiquinone/menaquinone biosynthesis C-methylase UbiE
MSSPVAMAVGLGASLARVGLYIGVNRLVDRIASARRSPAPRRASSRPTPSQRELLLALRELLGADAAAVRAGLYPPMVEDAFGLVRDLAPIRRMLRDLPAVIERAAAGDVGTARTAAAATGLPAYYVRDFHFQTGGYLTAESADLYDVQVDTLFLGAANAMRRAALRPIGEALAGRDQRRLSLLDVGCGTGRFLRQARLTFPGLRLAGLDLSPAYLDAMQCHMAGLRGATAIRANAEAMPLADASQDIVVSIFLYHELPADARRRITGEIHRVLRPGGTLVLIDSLQMGDRPDWDGLLEAFPMLFHEPFFDGYARDDLDPILADAGLAAVSTSLAFLAKVMVRRKA